MFNGNFSCIYATPRWHFTLLLQDWHFIADKVVRVLMF